MKLVKRKLSFLLVLALLVSMLLPIMSASAEVPSELNIAIDQQTILSPDTYNRENNSNLSQLDENLNKKVNSNEQESTSQNVIQDNSNNIEPQSLGLIIKKAAEYIIKKLGPKVKDQIWPKVKNKLDDIIETYNDLSVKGPGSGERVFALVSKKKGEVFRLDAKLLKKNDGYYLYVHYHSTPDMSDHHDIATIYIGKNKPPGFN